MFSTMTLPIPYQWVIYIFAVVNALNRPLLGVHYIMDVIVGLALGAFIGAGWLFILAQGALLP